MFPPSVFSFPCHQPVIVLPLPSGSASLVVQVYSQTFGPFFLCWSLVFTEAPASVSWFPWVSFHITTSPSRTSRGWGPLLADNWEVGGHCAMGCCGLGSPCIVHRAGLRKLETPCWCCLEPGKEVAASMSGRGQRGQGLVAGAIRK